MVSGPWSRKGPDHAIGVDPSLLWLAHCVYCGLQFNLRMLIGLVCATSFLYRKGSAGTY